MAFVKSSLATSSVTNACLAGASKVFAVPFIKAIISICQGAIIFAKVRVQIRKADSISAVYVINNRLLLGNLSATTPPRSMKSQQGTPVAKAT